MNVPKHLSHKPIIAVNDYDKIDALYANRTDARALSIGQAQYDDDEISLKVFRIVDGKWSRQSEELPIHRNLDLSILFLASLMTDTDSNYAQSSLREEVIENSRVSEITDYYNLHERKLKPRLIELKQILDKFLSL
ncbi:DUF6530 family protein [Pedobacter sp. MC2016-14]|uniref:DUF6530 family protein n=1 Tax=Pedobacter sp. MC2016-14 TaxID=2897327 RepID=UPI001E63C950|nr:DUF6530 family protein [Pedobacter sp. MC2016-14]MCD0487923.1 DUF6530 family protein [Pedobacter sp. MC2016-14]